MDVLAGAIATSGPPAFLAPTVALLGAAAVIGYLSVRLRVVPIVGFLLAGVLIGPAQLGLVDRQESVEAAAEVGVILLLFTIGIEFSLQRLTRIRTWILVGGGLQVLLTTLLVHLALLAWGVDWRASLFTGFLVSLSSTAIVLKLLGDAGQSSSQSGQLALAMLIFQDLAVVLMVLAVPMLGRVSGAAGSSGSAASLSLALLKAGLIIALVLLLARRVMPPLLERVARTCSPEVFLLTVVAICFGTAFLTALAGVSVSLGAFLAGLVVSESRHSAHAFGEVMPLQILFSATFFVSVGMLLDLGFVLRNLPLVLGGVLLVVLTKVIATGVAICVLRPGRVAHAAGAPRGSPGGAGSGAATASTGGTAGIAVATALLLAQVGEFSFVLETVGREAGLSPAGLGPEGSQTFIATSVVLMVATPLLAGLGRRAAGRLAFTTPRPSWTRQPPGRDGELPDGTRGDPDSGSAADARPRVLLSGWGPTAARLAADLRGHGIPLVVATLSPDGAAEAERFGHPVVRGDSAKQAVLRHAGLADVDVVVIPEDEPEHASRIAAVARELNPGAQLVVRPVGAAELDALAAAGVDKVVDSARTSSVALSASVLAELDATAEQGVDTTRIVRFNPRRHDGCPHTETIQPVLPSAPGCEECLRTGDRWVHLRVCLGCGFVGCCDSSPQRHARGHGKDTGHPLIASLQDGETWAYCYLDGTTLERSGSDGAQDR